MKIWKILAVSALLLLLCGCSRFVDSSYTVVTSHTTGATEKNDNVYLTVDSYDSLKSAIKNLVQNGIEYGTLRSYRYDGDLENDLAAAAYELQQEDPLVAYAVEYITHDCSLLVSYYEIHIHTAFRQTMTPMHQIEYVGGSAEITFLLEKALDAYDDHLTIYAAFSSDVDYDAIVETYCRKKLGSHAVWPEISLVSYPAEGRNRIDELQFSYGYTHEELMKMDADMEECLNAAGVYARYSKSELEKAQLLYSYLSERFDYVRGETDSPVYSVFCEGIVNDTSLTWAWQLLCEEAGINCYIVDGSYDGQSHKWNIIELDGVLYHVDLLQSLLSGGKMELHYDETMPGAYSWSKKIYPVCPAPEVAVRPQVTEEPIPTDIPQEDPSVITEELSE